jgi:Xaa-Pro aminopeptidase
MDEAARQIYAARRRRFGAQLGEGIALLPGAKLVRRVNDVDHVFRQQSDLLYLTGFAHPDAVAVLFAEKLVLFVQPRDRDAETWTGRRPGIEGAVAEYGADEAYGIAELPARLGPLLESAPSLFHRLGEDDALDRLVIDALRGIRRRERLGARAPRTLCDPYEIVHDMRLIKLPEELAAMRRAQVITRDAHLAAARSAHPGAFEYELEAELAHVFRRFGGAGPAYPSIVATGQNATILHYTENTSELCDGEVVLIDAGVEYEGYAADVTRTYPVGGTFRGAARDVYASVLAAQHAALAAVRPGSSLDEVHDVAVRSLSAALVELGILAGGLDEILGESLYRRYYMHRTGHFLGLDVHDVGSRFVGKEPRALLPGMVITVEPGLYMRSDEEGCPEAFRGIGVRIEDDVLVTEDGCELLSHEVPKELSDVEAWMRA